MPEPDDAVTEDLVITTGPILAITAALGDLNVLQVYRRVLVPLEVCQEVLTGGPTRFAVTEFEAAEWLRKQTQLLNIMPVLLNTLDLGEAAVIQLALNEYVDTVCIDESVGRRMARLNGLKVTGSIGVLLRAKREGSEFSMRQAIKCMQSHGVWLSRQVIAFALKQAGEQAT